MRQRLRVLEAEQSEQREALTKAQAAERERAEASWREELAALLEQQADETDEFERLSINDDYFVPVIHLYFNDDLTIM